MRNVSNLTNLTLTYSNNELQAPGQLLSSCGSGAPVHALILQFNFSQSGRLIQSGLRGRHGRREGGGELVRSGFSRRPGDDLFPRRVGGDEARKHTWEGGCRADGGVDLSVVFGWLDDS